MIDITQEKRLHHLLKSCGHTSHTHLYYLGDKEWFWDTEHEALIVYRSVGKRRIVLGDPIGKSPESTKRVVEQFIADCHEHKRIPVFYQAKAAFLPLYEKLGLQFVKIGEEAQVDLSSFHLNGKHWLKLRNRINKFLRNGYSFQVMLPPYSDPFLNRLQAISDEWLSDRKEKSFSVGSFSPDYVSRFPVAVLVGPDGNYEAFVSIAGDHYPLQAAQEEAPVCRKLTVDLMRYTKACPHGTMDVLFISLFKWAQENKYDFCSLGMAPLANAGDLLIVKLLYKYGNKLYNFKGLYDYKNKFAPKWEDVYLVYQPATISITAMLLAFIIHRPCTKQLSQDKSTSKLFMNGSSISRKRA